MVQLITAGLSAVGGATATAGAMSTMQTIGMVTSGISALAQISAGEQQKRMYEQRAKNERLQSRVEAINAKKKGVKALENVNASLASILAGSFRGGIAPDMGTINDRSVFLVQRPGANDYFDTQWNATMAINTGEMRAKDFEMAGKQAQTQGYIMALSSFGNAMMNSQSISPMFQTARA